MIIQQRLGIMLLIMMVCTCSTAAADSVFTNTEQRNLFTDKKGFTHSLPRIERSILLTELKLLQFELWSKQQRLLTLLKQKSFKVTDAIITLVAPGGILYALARQQDLKKTRTNLAKVHIEIDQLRKDVLALETSQHEIQIALAQ